MKPIITLAAVDLSPESGPVVDCALRLASDHPQAEVHVVAVREPTLEGPPSASQLRDLVVPLRELTLDRVREFSERRPAHSVNRVVVHALAGHPTQEIVGLGAHLEADTIVVGSHGRGGVGRSVLGSVSERVVRLAGCPVFVVRPVAHADALRTTAGCDACASARTAETRRRLRCAAHADHHVDAHVHAYPSAMRPWSTRG